MEGEIKWLADLMVPRPGRQPPWARTLRWLGLAFLALWKALRLPVWVWPRPVRAILIHWNRAMFGVVLRSFVSRAYIDQPCVFSLPERIGPAAEVDARHALSLDELRRFYEDGFAGPFDAFPEDEIRRLGDELLERRARPCETYGFATDRDLHFESPALRAALRHPAIVERLAQILGPDLLCWRSQVFYKPPGARAIQWHQASTFIVEDYLEPPLVPPDRDQIFQVTVWVAVDPATRDNGCLQFVRGSHARIHTIRFGGVQGFYDADFELEFDVDPARVATLEARPGQFILFSERCVHSSGPNLTDRNRLAFNFRVVAPDVRIYRDAVFHRAMHMGESYDLTRWGALVLRGQDRVGKNRLSPL